MLIIGHDLGAERANLTGELGQRAETDVDLAAVGTARINLETSLVEPDDAFTAFFDIAHTANRLGIAQFLQVLRESDRSAFIGEFERYVGRSNDMYVLVRSMRGALGFIHFPAAGGQSVVDARLYALDVSGSA